ncbi:tight adherence pilus pseudopilin TadF [Budvicia diplopodorum]|uniref:tight adherence pilus pseudopilin TadF n=1 Tax=Budvicia diplopodorum TaxID=1119056 RepID=UPI001FE2F312|nr:tight adherence pilus pseudopilin TadF [Budvicia diplopodorum]
MFKNMNVRPLLTNESGSVAVEFAMIGVVLTFLTAFLVDLVLQQAMIGKLDRVTYSVAGTLRERTQLYHNDEYLNQRQVDTISQLAKKVLLDMESGADLSNLSITVEELHFVEPKLTSNLHSRVVSRYNSFRSGPETCTPYTKLNNMQDLSPKGSYGRWVPMYQVTLCLPSVSWFTRFTGGGDGKTQHKSFSIVVVR